MISLKDMKERITEALYHFSAHELPSICTKLGLDEGDSSEAFKSKRVYIKKRIAAYDKKEIISLLYEMKSKLEINLIPEELYTYNITNLTKTRIKEILLRGFKKEDIFFNTQQVYKIRWHGIIEPISFLKRITDVSKIIVEDTRYDSFEKELWQHTENNDDYDIDWFFEFERLPYKQKNNIEFLKIIAEMFHPEVRDENGYWKEILEQINQQIMHDGYELYESGSISGCSIYSPRKITFTNNIYIENINEIIEKIDSEYLRKNISLLQANIKENPSVSIGKAKEMLETTLKYIADIRKIELPNNPVLTKLDKMVRQELKLDATKENTKIPGVGDILGGLAKITNGMGDLRNSYGDGHGKNANYRELPERYAKLAVGATVTYVLFLLDTLEYIDK